MNTNELFKAVDFDNSGSITEDEWLAFWQIVKKSGHSEKEITEEVEQLPIYITLIFQFLFQITFIKIVR